MWGTTPSSRVNRSRRDILREPYPGIPRTSTTISPISLEKTDVRPPAVNPERPDLVR